MVVVFHLVHPPLYHFTVQHHNARVNTFKITCSLRPRRLRWRHAGRYQLLDLNKANESWRSDIPFFLVLCIIIFQCLLKFPICAVSSYQEKRIRETEYQSSFFWNNAHILFFLAIFDKIMPYFFFLPSWNCVQFCYQFFNLTLNLYEIKQ